MNDGSLYPRGFMIELVEGCNRRCSFCPLSFLPFPRDHRKFMTISCAKKIIQNLSSIRNNIVPNPKVFFAMTGEPLLNPNFCEITELFRVALPESNFALITNGDLLPKQDIKRIMRTVDIVILDAYTKKSAEDAVTFGKSHGVCVIDFYNKWAPSGKSPFVDLKRNVKNTIVIMDAIDKQSGKVHSRTMHNYGGNAPLSTKRINLKKVCVNPIREIVIKHDGTVTLCCMDVGNEFIAGNLSEQSADEIWFSPAMVSARKLLRRGFRGFSPCAYCDACLPSSYTITNTSDMEWPQSVDFSEIRHLFHSLKNTPTKNGRERFVC